MKKKIGYVLLFVLVALALSYIIRYKTGPCVCDTIPDNADAAVLVNVRNLENHILLDGISHPLDFFGSGRGTASTDTSKKKGEGAKKDLPASKHAPSIMSCISLPKALVMYRTSDDGAWYTSMINIKSEEKLKSYLNKKGFISKEGSSVYSKGQQHVVLHGDRMQAVFSDDAPQIEDASNPQYLQSGDLIFDRLSGTSEDVLYADAKGQQVYLNFESGAITLDGKYHVEALQPSTEIAENNGIGGLFASFDVAKLFDMLNTNQKDKITNFTKLQMDSLQVYWDGSFSGSLHGIDVVADTIKTYDYDDDFNKIEVKKVQEMVKPAYDVQLGMDTTGIAYLKRKKAIVVEDGEEVFALMPLVKTYCESKDGLLFLNSGEEKINLSPSDYKLSFYLDAQAYQKSNAKDYIPFMNKVKQLKSATLKISNNDEVEGRVVFNSNRNALVAMMGK